MAEPTQADKAQVNGPKERDAAAKEIPAHEGEQAVTRDTTPSVERPGHEATHPDRPPVK